ncbi:MAG TPA: hypothetical protein VF405_08560 [Gammaproteobacteria bacterium]
MRHMLSIRSAASALCATAAVGLAACKSVSIHDPQLAAAALQAQSAFTSAGSGDLWTTMTDNLERGSKVERELFASTLDMRFEGQLQGIRDLKWNDIADCGQGQCGESLTLLATELTGETVLAPTFDSLPTDQKIAATTADMAKIGEEIAALSKLMADDPSGAKETGELSPPPTSAVADAIGEAAAQVALFEQKLNAAKQAKIGQLEEAISNFLPELPDQLGARGATIRMAFESRIGELRAALGAASIDALAATAATETNRLLTAAGATPDDGLNTQFAQLIRSTFGSFTNFEAHLEVANELLNEADALVAAALGEGTAPFERLAVVADVLRKSEHLDVLKPDTVAEVLDGVGDKKLTGDVAEAFGVDTVEKLVEAIRNPDTRNKSIEALADKVSVQKLLDEVRDESLSTEFKAALKQHTGSDIGDIGALLDYLKTDESRLQEVRVALLADWRRAVVEGRALELESLRYRLGLAEKLVRALEAQQFAERGIASQLDATRACLPTLALNADALSTLTSVARGAALRFDSDCEEDFDTNEKQFENLVGILGAYFTRIGYLHDNERLAQYELVLYEHRRSIDASRLAAAAHEQLVSHGLQGLVTFTQGGLTSEQIATVLRFLNVGLLSEIANQE